MSATTRWRLLLICLALTVAAILAPVEEDEGVSGPHPLPSTKVETLGAEKKSSFTAEVEIDETDDPFAPRSWTAVIEPVVVSQAPSPAVVEASPVIESTPPLPFKFLGKFNDGTELVVYLGRGEQTLVAKNGETLEGIYKVVDITEKSIEFVYLPRDEKQSLMIEQ